MSGQIPVPRRRPRPTWQRVLASFALASAIPLSLWAISQPRIGALLLATVVVLFVVSRIGLRAARCLCDCGGFVLDFGGIVRITIRQPQTDAPC